MLALDELGEEVARRRRQLGLTQTQLAERSRLARSTIDALENGRLRELGYKKVYLILRSLGMEIVVREATGRRDTLEDLLAEGEV
jgi:transcriptional regulator with XRE-family HTH domain